VASRNAAVAPLPRIAASRAMDQVRTRTASPVPVNPG
jgi:hypothetical protein